MRTRGIVCRWFCEVFSKLEHFINASFIFKIVKKGTLEFEMLTLHQGAVKYT